MYLDEFNAQLEEIVRACELDGDVVAALGKIHPLVDEFAWRFTDRNDVVWAAARHLRQLSESCASLLVYHLVSTLTPSEIKRRTREDEEQRHARLEETAAKLMKALDPLDGILEINGVAFMMLAQEVQSSGVTPMELTLADVALMLGKASVRYGRMEKRLGEIKAEG